MNPEKPNKKIIFYWFVEKGFFFLFSSFFIIGTLLKYTTSLHTLTLYLLNLSILTLFASLAFLIYQWLSTEYYLLNKHVFIKTAEHTKIIPYSNIKKVGYYGNLLQHLMGTTNIQIQTKNNENYYIEGVRDYKKIENDILKKI